MNSGVDQLEYRGHELDSKGGNVADCGAKEVLRWHNDSRDLRVVAARGALGASFGSN
jgi:hypothetical protein